MRNTIEMSRTIVPKHVNNREVFEVSPRDIEKGFCKGEGGVYDDVECD